MLCYYVILKKQLCTNVVLCCFCCLRKKTTTWGVPEDNWDNKDNFSKMTIRTNKLFDCYRGYNLFNFVLNIEKKSRRRRFGSRFAE